MNTLKRFLVSIVVITLWSMSHVLAVYGADSLLKTGKTDSAIKPLVFPKSMVIIRSCHLHCLSLESDQKSVVISPKITTLRLKQLQISYKKNEAAHKKAVKKWLVRLDPARIAPATRGEDFEEMISRHNLKKLAKTNHTASFIFVFHQVLVFNRQPWVIRTRGLIYLTQQNKLIALRSNDQNLEIQKDMAKPLHTGLQQLAEDARKGIMSYKFEKRRSNY